MYTKNYLEINYPIQAFEKYDILLDFSMKLYGGGNKLGLKYIYKWAECFPTKTWSPTYLRS